MKYFVVVLLFVGAVAGCTNAPKAPVEPDAGKTLFDKQDTAVNYALSQLLNQINASSKSAARFNAKSNEIFLGDTIIRLKIKVEFEGQKQGQYVYAANFETTLKTTTQTTFNAGAIGMGNYPQQAFEVCVQEWLSAFGSALADLIGQTNPLLVANFKVYSGRMGLKGNMPGNSWVNGTREMDNKIIRQVTSVLEGDKNKIVPLDIKLLIDRKGVSDGECRVGNVISFALLEELKKLNWPAPAQKAIFSQYYLVERK